MPPPKTKSFFPHSWSIPSFATSVLLFGLFLLLLRQRKRSLIKKIFPWLSGSVRSLPPLRAGAILSVGLQLSSFSNVFFFPLKPKLRLNHPQACCTWLISSPKRSNSPSTQAPFSRHFCTVSSCPSSPVCTRRDAIWRWEGTLWCQVQLWSHTNKWKNKNKKTKCKERFSQHGIPPFTTHIIHFRTGGIETAWEHLMSVLLFPRTWMTAYVKYAACLPSVVSSYVSSEPLRLSAG